MKESEPAAQGPAAAGRLQDERESGGRLCRLFCFGLGYAARHIARRLAARGWGVAGTTRAPVRAEALAAEGFEMHLFGGPEAPLEDPAAALSGRPAILHSIPPGPEGDPVLRAHREGIADARPRWIGYLSTTGVYGDRGGGWVDEETEPAPGSDRSKRRVAAEAAWLAFGRETGLAVQVFRLSGIYGPGRSALDRARQGRPAVYREGQVFGRIHVEDIARTLEASLARPDPGRIYNLADDRPAASAEVLEAAARLLGLEPPARIPYEEAELSPMAASFFAESRRVSNRRIKEELGVTLAYPDYEAGLRAILDEEKRA